MASKGAEDILPKIEESSTPENERCRLLSLPLELREKIYSHIFTTIHARRYKHRSSNELAILQTCAKIHEEASSTLYNRTPLRFIIGHRQVTSSELPASAIVDRFQNIFFKLNRMSSTHPSYEFDVPWNKISGAFMLSTIKRKTCTIQCELEEFAGRSCAPSLFKRVKDFTDFDALSITFEGQVLKSESFKIPLIGDYPQTQGAINAQMYRKACRASELQRWKDLEKHLLVLEKYLGKGSIIDLSESSKALYARRLVFHPLQHNMGTQS